MAGIPIAFFFKLHMKKCFLLRCNLLISGLLCNVNCAALRGNPASRKQIQVYLCKSWVEVFFPFDIHELKCFLDFRLKINTFVLLKIH